MQLYYDLKKIKGIIKLMHKGSRYKKIQLNKQHKNKTTDECILNWGALNELNGLYELQP